MVRYCSDIIITTTTNYCIYTTKSSTVQHPNISI